MPVLAALAAPTRTLTNSASYSALVLLRAWRAGEPVTATLRGTTIVSLD